MLAAWATATLSADGTPRAFACVTRETRWTDVTFVSDRPGKYESVIALSGGGLTTTALAKLVDGAKSRVLIQSPYLVMSEAAMVLFGRQVKRGVTVRINTNSLASTDNLPGFSGYRSQRARLLAMGIHVHEYKPAPEVTRALKRRAGPPPARPPVFSLHAKTLVVDSRIAYIGTFNFDPRSENLNTEVGVIARDEALARSVGAAIETDMAPGNSWDARKDNPASFASVGKRTRVRFYQFLQLKPLL